jgi:hypothetical protein
VVQVSRQVDSNGYFIYVETEIGNLREVYVRGQGDHRRVSVVTVATADELNTRPDR